MKKSTTSLIFTLLIIMALVSSCNLFRSGSKFLTTNSGLKYRMVVHNNDMPVPRDGKILLLDMTFGTADSIFFNSADNTDGVQSMPMQKSAFPGDFYEMMEKMHLGDSAVFMLDADTFFLKTAKLPTVPDFAKNVDELVFHVKLQKITTEAEMMKLSKTKLELMRDTEEKMIQEYILKNGIETLATESGLYLIITEKGDGAMPAKGDRVRVHYTGMLLDGTKFDSSVDRGDPFVFPLGQGRVIGGWDEGISMLNVGSKARLIIPSSLGYGERGAGGQIPPYAPLIFDVELLGIE